MLCSYFVIDDYIRGGLYRGEKRVMFQMQHLQVLFEAAHHPEHFDTFFNKIGQKMRQRRPKNQFWTGGVRGGGSENNKFGNYLNYIPYLSNVWVNIYVFEVKESIFKSFVSIRPFVSLKMDILGQIRLWGRFCH